MRTPLGLSVLRIALTVCISTTACAVECQPTYWTVMAPAAAASIDLSIRRGECSAPGETLFRVSAARGVGEPTSVAPPPELRAGTYAVAARALDSTCAVIAVDCVELHLPRSACLGGLVLAPFVAPAAPEMACAPAACAGGVCQDASDAGP